MAGITIKNPSNGQQAFVTSDGQLLTQAESLSLQHFISRYRGQAYQTQFFDTGIGNGTNNVGFIQNDSTTLSLVATFIRLQAMDLSGGTAVPSSDTYWQLGFGETYSSGGSSTASVNMNRGSGNVSSTTSYDTNPTLSGTFTEFDRLYVQNEGQESFNKEGSLILGPNDSMSLKLVTDNTSGTGYARLTYMMMDLSTI